MQTTSRTLLSLSSLFIWSVQGFGTEQITTNEIAWRAVAGWRQQVAAGRAADVIAALDEAMRGPAQWRAPVLSGEGWAYPWGFFALETYARACRKTGQPVRAYRALANAFTYLPTSPPPAYAAGEYWRWYIAMGEVCAWLGRTYDAQWYLQQARSGLSTNDGLYYKATSRLAGVASRLGEYDRAAMLLDEVFAARRRQPTPVWHDYIRLLFLRGRFDEGVAAIFAGARANGFSARFLERDYFMLDAARYWHFFSDADVLDWYDFLGQKLERIRPRAENEKLIALLINTRTLMKQAHPELLALADDDIKALRERLAREEREQRAASPPVAEQRRAAQPAAARAPLRRSTAQSPLDALACSVSAGAVTASNILLEDTVNGILHEMVRQRMYSYGSAEPWLNVLRTFASNTLAEVYIDGAPAGWLAQAMLVTIYADEHRGALATNWVERALESVMLVNNPTRMAELFLWIGDVHLTKELRDLERVKQFAEWAREVAPSNQRVYVEAQSQLSGVARLTEGPRARATLLQELMDRHGCTLRQAMYERLARDYFVLGREREAVAVLFEGMKRTPMKLEGGRFNHFVETLYCARSLLTVEELERYRAMLRAAAMRYPATLANVPAAVKALTLANAAWFDEHLALARIERAETYGEEQWALICTAALQRASARAGALHVFAQAARDRSGTNDFDWSGWLAGWQGVERESMGPPTLGETGVRERLYEKLLGVLRQHEARMSEADRRQVVAALEERLAGVRDGSVRGDAVRLLERWGATNSVTRLHGVWEGAEKGKEVRVQRPEGRSRSE